jgi:hypothetical protein
MMKTVMTARVRFGCVLLCVTLTIGLTNGFVAAPPLSSPSRFVGVTRSRTTTGTTRQHPPPPSNSERLYSDATGWDNFCIEQIDSKYVSPEEARRYRRTVYTHDDWKKHRSQERNFVYLKSLFDSGVYRNCQREVLACTAVATFVCLYNALVGGYTDFAGIQHAGLLPGLDKMGLPVSAFTTVSSALGLLLSKSCSIRCPPPLRGCVYFSDEFFVS